MCLTEPWEFESERESVIVKRKGNVIDKRKKREMDINKDKRDNSFVKKKKFRKPKSRERKK